VNIISNRNLHSALHKIFRTNQVYELFQLTFAKSGGSEKKTQKNEFSRLKEWTLLKEREPIYIIILLTCKAVPPAREAQQA
jgi:hypothetical protein